MSLLAERRVHAFFFNIKEEDRKKRLDVAHPVLVPVLL